MSWLAKYSAEDVQRLLRLCWFPESFYSMRNALGESPRYAADDRQPTKDVSKAGDDMAEYADIRSVLRYNEQTFKVEVNKGVVSKAEARVLFLRYVLDIEASEIEHIVGLPADQVRAQCSAGIRKIRKALNYPKDLEVNK